MILYDKILWADDTLFITSRWYMLPYYDYARWCIVYPGICGRLCIHTLWCEESDLRTPFDLTYLWLCQSKSLSLSGTKDQNSSILGTKLRVDLGFLGILGPWATNSEHPATCPGLWVYKSCFSETFVAGVILRMKLLWANGWCKIYKEKAGYTHDLETKL